jgi:hypothetical protein
MRLFGRVLGARPKETRGTMDTRDGTLPPIHYALGTAQGVLDAFKLARLTW